jgi:hypothetical protein
MQFSAASCHFIPLRSKYSPQHLVLKQHQSAFFNVRYQVSHPYNIIGTNSAILIKKTDSGILGDPKFGWRGEGVSYINARKKRFWNTVPACVLLRLNFQNGVPAHSVKKCPWV